MLSSSLVALTSNGNVLISFFIRKNCIAIQKLNIINNIKKFLCELGKIAIINKSKKMLLSDQQPIGLNVKFKGSYELLCWILKKYKKELPYSGYIGHFATANNYYFTCSKEWKRYGVNYKVWNLLHKDLTIAYLMNKIEVANLIELEKEFNQQKK